MTYLAGEAGTEDSPILHAAIRLAEQIREASDKIETGRRIPPPSIAVEMKEAGIFGMAMLGIWGGPELDRELRRIAGFWYELRFGLMPNPVYRVAPWRPTVRLKPLCWTPTAEIELTPRRLISPPVRDAVTGNLIELGPAVDEPVAWSEYRHRHPDRRYAVAKRRLCKAELRRYGLRDHAPEDGPIDPTPKPDRVAPYIC